MSCWINGQFLSKKDSKISPFDHGFLYGLGFYELFRTYQGRVLFIEERFNRLCSSLNLYRIKMPYTINDIKEVISELFNQANREDGIYRLNVSAGTNDLDLPSQYAHPNVIVYRRPMIKRERGTEKKAQWLQTPRNTPEQQLRFKSHHFGNNVLARFEVENLNTTEGFFVTSKGFIAEGITSNIFWARDGILYTPSLSTGIIPGITRQWLIVTAKRFGIRVVEDVFFKSELENAYECFITNSIEEIVPISNIGKKRFLGENGPMYQRFHQAYIEEVVQMMKRG